MGKKSFLVMSLFETPLPKQPQPSDSNGSITCVGTREEWQWSQREGVEGKRPGLRVVLQALKNTGGRIRSEFLPGITLLSQSP